MLLRHVETRWQVAGFATAIMLVELAGRQGPASRRAARALLLAAAAAVGVIAAKARLEPHAVHADIAAVKQGVRAAKPDRR